MSTPEIVAFYEAVSQALSRLDLETALSYFADDENMVKISNGHVMRGKQQLADYWQGRLGNVGALHVTMDHIEIHPLDDDHLWTVADEYITIDGQTQKAVVTNILVRTAQGWKILLDHTTYLT